MERILIDIKVEVVVREYQKTRRRQRKRKENDFSKA